MIANKRVFFNLLQASSATPKFNKTCSTKLKRVDHYKKSESRKHERIYFERKLQSNLDQYVTRAVTELVYRTPEDVEDAGSRPENHGNSQDDTPPPVDGGLADGVHTPGGTSELIARESFPIPMGVRTSFFTKKSCVCRRDDVCVPCRRFPLSLRGCYCTTNSTYSYCSSYYCYCCCYGCC